MADELGARPPADAPEAVAVLLSRSKGEAATIATAYRQWMEAPTDARPQLAPSTVGRRLAALSSLVATAYRSDLIGWELTLKGPKVAAYRDTRGPGADAVADMVEALDPSTAAGARDRAIVLALAGMGLRRGELVALDLADLDTDRGTLMVTGKGRTQAVPLTVPPAVLDALAAWIDHRGTEPGPLFHGFRGKAGRLNGGSVARIVAKAAKVAEVAGHRPPPRAPTHRHHRGPGGERGQPPSRRPVQPPPTPRNHPDLRRQPHRHGRTAGRQGHEPIHPNRLTPARH
jgi:integrase